MSLKDVLKFGRAPDASTVARLETKLAAAQADQAAAQSQANAAALEAEESDTAAARSKADKAQAAAAAVKARVETLTGALREARARAAAAQEAENQAQREKEAREAAAKRAAAFDRADKTGVAVEKCITDLSKVVREALDAQRGLQPYFGSDEFATQMLTAHLNLHACLAFHLRSVPGVTGPGMAYDAARARWAQYLPSTVLPRERKVAA